MSLRSLTKPSDGGGVGGSLLSDTRQKDKDKDTDTDTDANTRRVLLNAIHRRSILLLDGACRGTLLPTLVPLFIISTNNQNNSQNNSLHTDSNPTTPLSPVYSYTDSLGAVHPANLSPYLWSGLCVGTCLLFHTIGVGLGSSHLLGRLVVPSNPNRAPPTSLLSSSNFRFSLLSSLPISLTFLLLTSPYSPLKTLLLKSLQMFLSGLACRIASIRIKVNQPPSFTSNRPRSRTYSHVFGGRLNMGDDDPQTSTSTKYDDSGLSTRVSSGAVRVYITGVGLMCWGSGLSFDRTYKKSNSETGGYAIKTGTGSVVYPTYRVENSWGGYGVVGGLVWFVLVAGVASTALRMWYNAEVMAGRQQMLVEVYFWKVIKRKICGEGEEEGMGYRQVDGDLEMGGGEGSNNEEAEGFLGQRSRARTNTDEFFECLDDDVDSGEEFPNNDDNDDNEDDDDGASESPTTVYRNRMIVDEATGEVSHLPPTLKAGRPPQNFIKAVGSMAAAKRNWAAHLAWRKSARIGSIHTRPHVHFDKVKKHYPHFLHGHSRDGYPVVYEQPGKMDLKGLFESGLTIDDMIHHFVYHMEFMTQVTRPRVRREAKMTMGPGFEATSGLVVVMDVKGLSLSKLSGDVVKYLKAAGDMTNNHYPGSQHKVLIVNAPFWFSGAWGGLKNVLPKETAEAANVASTNYISSLTAHIDPGQIPREYCGSSNHPATLHPYELELRNFVESCPEEEGLEEGRSGPQSPSDVKSQNSSQFDTPPNANAQHFAFDHVEKRWVPDDDNSEGGNGSDQGNLDEPPDNPRLRKDSSASVSMVQAGEWSTELSVVSPRRDGAVRRTPRSNNYDEGIHVGKAVPVDAQHLPGEEQSPAMHQRVLSISTALVFLSCGLQASAEAVTFFFLLFPTEFGGLGMDALEAGNLALICTVVIVILSTRRQLRRMARLPTRAPLRAFRIGMGAEAFAFVLFPIFPRIFGTGSGFLPYFFNVVGLVALVLTSTLSRAASAVLHRIASSSYSKLASDDGLDGPSLTFCGFDLRNYLYGGGFTATVTALGEFSGAVFGSFAYYHFVKDNIINNVHGWPLDSSLVFNISFLVCVGLYFLSLALHLNIVGDYGGKGRAGAKDEEAGAVQDLADEDDYLIGEDLRERQNQHLPSRCGLWGEILHVPASDLAVLIEQATWR
ncbi:hypothetical protein TrVE_jg9594 [Triparma verrucosa]|uniref:CRAL-TRIO domain-containing protein n=1 Tax=Triparma verrucosa TaxID=1606542 RepID=A0A9W7KTK3_9STRA|nr:hypothetical protein TrVE_jg9594 [Triparma verrucosa]